MLAVLSLCLVVLFNTCLAGADVKQCVDNDALSREIFAAIESAIKVSQYGRQDEKLKALDRLEKHVGKMRPLIMAEKVDEEPTYRDCQELMDSGETVSGLYTITFDESVSMEVYCDMITDGGGWTVFQRRQDGTENFDLDLQEYTVGFGDKVGEFWLGNDALRNLTANGRFELRVDMWDWNDTHKYATYDGFEVSGEDYRLSFQEGSYDGNAGDSLDFHNGWGFTTKDHDVDGASSGNCAIWLYSGWWFNYCHRANLNGHYKNQLDAIGAQDDQGIQWTSWHGFQYSLKKTEMKFRPQKVEPIVATNCEDLDSTVSGVYTINPVGMEPIDVYCDFETADGGWTVFQRRESGSISFDKQFEEFAVGFGDPSEEFWLGNYALRNMTDSKLGAFELRVDMWDWEGNYTYADYSDFSVTGDDFTLRVESYSGSAGDSLSYHSGMGFTTRDHDVDNAGGDGNCAEWLYSGWWFNFCHRANLNGRFKNELDAAGGQRDQGIQWTSWKGFNYSLKKVEMKFRPVYHPSNF